MSPVAPIRRAAAAAPPVEGVNFGDLSLYVAGGGLPEGDYALEFTVEMYQALTKENVARGPQRLGAMVKAHSLSEPGAEPRTQFYSFGSSADKSFAPNPDTGKGVVAVPGGPATTLNNSTNWAILLKSLYDCGLPVGIFTNDFSVLDGIHVHMTNVPEPEERKGFQSKTGDAAEERKAGTIAIVTEIKEDGKPWEGTGGIPDASAPKPAARGAARPTPVAQRTAAPKATSPKAVAKVAPAPVAAPTDDDVATAAQNGIATVLEKADNANGCTKLLLRTGSFKAIDASEGKEMASAVLETYFDSDEHLNLVLEPMGYVSAGGKISVA